MSRTAWVAAASAFLLFGVFAGASLALAWKSSQQPDPIDHTVDIRLAGVWDETASLYVQSAPILDLIPLTNVTTIMDMAHHGDMVSIDDKNLTVGDWFFFRLPDCEPHTIQVMVNTLSAFSAVVQMDCSSCILVLPQPVGCVPPEQNPFSRDSHPEVRS